MKQRYIKKAEVINKDEKQAVADLAVQLYQDDPSGVIFFCSSTYDLDKLAEEINTAFPCPVVGCTTAGEIGKHYQTHGIVGISFSSKAFRVHPHLMTDLSKWNSANLKSMSDEIKSELHFTSTIDEGKMFCFLLIDGLSMMEEKVTADLHSVLNNLSIIGGSAGDSLNFKETLIYCDGKFITDAAVMTLIETRLPFSTFMLMHFEPTQTDLVITEADPSRRIVFEINGDQAAEEYARLIGKEVGELNSDVFAMHPFMLQIGDNWYVRSIQKANEDGSLTFYCAIECGLVLNIGRGVGISERLNEQVKKIQADFNDVELTLGCDCILRRLEIIKKEKTHEVESELNKINFVGFSTYGEQYNSIHINQTLTGVVFGSEIEQ